ncbi:unnamed protein product [Nippostrongylus brasiliensis]|uniref:Pyridoxamine 5'-phosphate oxidase family protein n=1 Tax=Nippostrongylus brasiliensis TaxID=27835 RepID=A0A0N4YGG7_NIPBR|nr:unnamed protein product [Nippostrongylus brasiliensis]
MGRRVEPTTEKKRDRGLDGIRAPSLDSPRPRFVPVGCTFTQLPARIAYHLSSSSLAAYTVTSTGRPLMIHTRHA